MKDQRKQLIDAIQTVIVLVAVPMGALPLIQAIFDFDQGGLFRFVFSQPSGSARWAIPVVVVIVATVLVLAVERLPKRIGGGGQGPSDAPDRDPGQSAS